MATAVGHRPGPGHARARRPALIRRRCGSVGLSSVALASVALASVVLVALVAFAAPVEAHSGLADTAPGANATVSEPPKVVRLTFGDDVLGLGAQVSLTAPDGRRISAERVTVNGSSVAATFPGVVRGGQYRVAWRVVADDGHPETGDFGFTYAAASSPSAPAQPGGASTEPAADSVSVSQAGSAEDGSGVPWVLVGVGAVVVLAIVALRQVRTVRQGRSRAR